MNICPLCFKYIDEDNNTKDEHILSSIVGAIIPMYSEMQSIYCNDCTSMIVKGSEKDANIYVLEIIKGAIFRVYN